MGVYLGTLFLVQGNLLAPIVTHALYDFVALVWVAHRYRSLRQHSLGLGRG
jgi:membrane protease YdiL (CAAX protease family)